MARNRTRHRDNFFETLEGRSLMSAAALPPATGEPSGQSAQVAVADESFLTGSSDAAGAGQSGGVWLDDGAVDQTSGRSGWTQMPADVTGLVQSVWGEPAAYAGAPPIVTADFADPADAAPADAPVPPGAAAMSAAVTAAAPATPTVQPPTRAAAGASETSAIRWIESGSGGSKTGSAAVESQQVVIASTYVKR